ncbi:hypothetical protein MR626_04370 [bacterium]|nr:hypothetical protein [bacterium]MDY4582287.1 hypothetical protein [Candidatus Faecousia sp.]
MRKGLCLLLVLCLFLSGCTLTREGQNEVVTFYYLREEYQYGAENSVIVAEEREASGHGRDLSYLLAFYLMGPMKEGLVCPLPEGTGIVSVEQASSGISLVLTDTLETLSDADYSLACACLTLTCLNITGGEKVTITSGSRSVTMTRNTLTLFDGGTAETEETQ